MTKPKPICFISYSHEGIDRDTFDYFRSVLDGQSNGEYEIKVDQALEYGANLNRFMELLTTSTDVVIILMTPAYKRKILDREGGVYEEYRRIISRYEQLESEKQKGKKSGQIEGYFVVVPVLFSGTHATSVPKELEHLKYLDLVGLRVFRSPRGEFRVPDPVTKRYLPEIHNIVDRIRVVRTLKSRDFDTLYSNYYSRLFRELLSFA